MESILQTVIKIQEQNRTDNRPRYNVFSVLGIQSKEVLTCRMIADLIDPKGAHGQGDVFLKMFLENVIGIWDISKDDTASARVTAEYLIDGLPGGGPDNRRIDMVIEAGRRFIPIEVKIYAGDQRQQCFDYYRFAKTKDPEAKIYYLTLFGDMPGQDSISRGSESIPKDDIVALSFQRDIIAWLYKCQEVCTWDSVKQILLQFSESIAAIAENPGEKEIQMAAEELSSSSAKLSAGLLIDSAIDDAKALVLRNVFAEFEKQMEMLLSRYPIERETVCDWYEYRNCVTRNFFHGQSTFPGINYIVKDVNLPDNLQLWLRIEVEWNLYAGFCIFDPIHKKEVEDLTCIKEQLRETLGIQLQDTDGWWAEWCYLPTGRMKEDNEVPNFRVINHAAVSLADEETRISFVRKSIDVIEKGFLQRILK